MTGYTKLFGSIIASTIWSEDDQTRIVWITMLAMADKHGEVQASIPGLAKFSQVPIHAVEAALVKLKAPDAYSRTKERDGRRIEEIDGGWVILNHAKYRAKSDIGDRKEQARIRKQRQRKRHADVTQCHAMSRYVTKCHDIAEAEAEALAESGPNLPECNAPSVEEVIRVAQMEGLAEWKARDWFDEMSGCGWIDHNLRPIRDWRSVMCRVRTKWEADGRPSGPPGRSMVGAAGGGRNATVFPSTRLAIIKKLIANNPANRESLTAREATPKDREELKKLRAEQEQIERGIAGL